MPTLTIQLPNLPPVEHVLRDDTMTIGRMKGNTIALDDASVSISHAKITRVNGEFFVKDLNSTNGTMLNGQSIVEARLRDGDQIKFGEVVAYFRGDQPSRSGISPAPAQAAQPAAAPAPQAPPAPSTAFVSKRLVTQASQLAASAPSTAVAASPAPATRGARRKKSVPVVPIIGIIAALAVAGILGWMFFGGGDGGKTPNTNTVPTVAEKKPVAAKPASADQLQNLSIADLAKLLKSSNPAERRNAASELHARGATAKDAVPELREALKDSDADVRMWAALALINNKSYDKATIPILIETLRQENPMLRQVACLSLAVIPYDPAEKPPVVAALIDVASKDSEADVREAATSALKIIAPEAVTNEK